MQKTALYYIFLFFLFSACKKDVSLNTVVQIDSIMVNDSIQINYEDSLVFVFQRQDSASLTFLLDLDKYDTHLQLELNNGEVIDSNSIVLDSTITEISSKITEGYFTSISSSPIYIVFGEHAFLDSLIVTDRLNLSMHDNSRGNIELTLYNRWGQEMVDTSFYKTDYAFAATINVNSFTPDLYIGRTIYGNEERVFKVVIL